MKITTEQAPGNTQVTILGLQGELDASNFESIIDKAKAIYEGGGRYLLLDLSELKFMSSSGIVALHSIVKLMRGQGTHDLESGWEVFRSIERDKESGAQPYVKLLNPQPRIAGTLQKSGMDAFFEIFDDQETALASFQV